MSAPPLTDKGLARGKVGALTGAVLGISCVAPGYTLTASIGLIAAAVGTRAPAIFLVGFVPMLLAASAYRELNRAEPDCGASFTWTARAFGPHVGWMCGWGMVAASVIVLSNLAAVAVQFLYLFLARALAMPWLARLPDDKAVNLLTTLVLLGLATAVATRGVEVTERVQRVLVGFQMLLLAGFCACALTQVVSGTAPARESLDASWFNPFSGLPPAAFAAGITGSLFAFWGWDTCLTLGEESKDPNRTPGRAGLLCVTSILVTYVVVAVAALLFAGPAALGGSDDVFGALAVPVMGSWGGLLLFLAVLASSVASLQTTFLPAARTMLAMGSHGAFPKAFARVHPRFRVPSFAAAVAGGATAAFSALTAVFSESALDDTVAALGIMICWYYGLTALACAWYFRRDAFASARDFTARIAFPVLGGVMLLGVLVLAVVQSADPSYGSGASLGGIGLVFFLGVGVLLLGAVLMLVMRAARPAFFKTSPAPAAYSDSARA